MTDEIERIVIETVAGHKQLDGAAVSLDTTFAELGFDSLDGLQVVFALEERFDINVPDHVTREMKTLRDVVDGLRALNIRPTAGDA